MNETLTAVPGVEVGHWTHASGTTGVTACLFPGSARGGVWVPGSATGSREMGVLAPSHLAARIHAFCLAGGSAFGLSAADGVMAFLEERDVGFQTPHGRVPIVPAAILFDLHSSTVRPDAAAGRAAAEAASDAPVALGRVGAAAGARVGLASGAPVPGGIGSHALPVEDFTVGVLVALNAVGSVRDPATGAWVAGGEPAGGSPPESPRWRSQTTLVIVATDAPLLQGQLEVLGKMASAGMARTLFPAFTPFDGDVVFTASTTDGEPVDAALLTRLGHAAAVGVERAILGAARSGVAEPG